MSIYRVMAAATLAIDEDRVEIVKDNQVMGLQARITYDQAVSLARSRVPDWKQLVFGMFGRDLRAEAEAQVSHRHYGILDVTVNLMLDAEDIGAVHARVRRVNENAVRSYRDVDVRWVQVTP